MVIVSRLEILYKGFFKGWDFFIFFFQYLRVIFFLFVFDKIYDGMKNEKNKVVF